LNTEVPTFVRNLSLPFSTYQSQVKLGTKIGSTNDYSVNGEEIRRSRKMKKSRLKVN
jgi:hypothetical protein